MLELHNYASDSGSCDSLKSSLYRSGFNALDAQNSSIVNVLPVMMTEFGFAQDDSSYKTVYASCLREYLPEVQAGWMAWELGGSYYIREGTQDFDETWGKRSLLQRFIMITDSCAGLLDHTWSDWRSSGAIEEGMIPMVSATLGTE